MRFRLAVLLPIAITAFLALPAAAFAVGSYNNAALADTALTRVGQSGGQCRAFVNNIVWEVSGHTQSTGWGNGAFEAFLANGIEIKDINSLVKGDIVQFEDSILHTFIIVSRASGNTFNVVDSNYNYDEIVRSHQITFSLSSTRRAFRLGTVSTPPPPPQPVTYDLQNGSFEQWSGATCVSWAFAGNAGGAGWRVTAPVRSGSAFGLTCPTSDGGKENDVRQPVLVEPGKSYTLSAWAMTDRNPDSVHTYLEFVDQAGNVLSAPGTSGDRWGVNGGTFSRMLLTATAPANAARVNVVLLINGGTYLGPGGGSTLGSVVFDDVTLDSANLTLQNSSFEQWSGSTCANWTCGSGAGGVVWRVTTPARSGSAFGMTCPTSDSGKVTVGYQAVLVEPGKSYTLGAWTVTDRNPGAVHMYLQFIDQAGNVLSAPGTSGDTWGVNGGTFSRMLLTATAPANAARVNVVLALNGGTYLGPGGGSTLGSAVFDDVTLDMLTGPPDATAPTTTASGADALWHSTPVTVTFTATDNAGGSGMSGGLAKTEYKLDSGTWTTGTSVTVAAPSDHSKDGEHTVSYRSIDAAGNTEAAKSATVKIDTAAPSGSFSLAGGAATTTTTAVSSDASVSDAHGPLEQRFSTDAKATWSGWRAYAASTPLTLPAGVGTKTVTAQYRDSAGNVLELSDGIELVAAAADNTAPTTTVSGADDAWHSAPVTLTFLASDNAGGSGMSGGQAKTEYKLDDAAWTAGTSLTVPAPPNTKTTHTILYRSTDNAGNVEVAKSCTVKIDTTETPPPLDTTAPTTTAHGVDSAWHAAPVVLTFTAADTGANASGVAFTEYKLDGDAWTKGSSLTIPAPVGVRVTHTVLFRSQDNAGNLEVAKSCTVKIDTTGGPPPTDPPTTTAFGYDNAWHRSPVTVTFSALPCVGGLAVAYTEYRLDGDEWTRATRVTVPASADHSADGVHTISYRSADIGVPANVEEEKTCTVKIDTLGPRTSARSASVRKGSAVSLRYHLDDTLSSQVAAVKVVVKNARGATVKSASLGTRSSDTWYSLRWTPAARGTYRYYVYGKDLAGNAQTKVGSAKVVVR